MNQSRPSAISDKVGITSAILCTVHCLVVPALFLLKGWYAGGIAQLPAWWAGIDVIFLVISFIAVYHSAMHTGQKQIKAALWVSWVLLAVAIMWEAQLHWLAYIASASLIVVHLFNIRRMRKGLYKS